MLLQWITYQVIATETKPLSKCMCSFAVVVVCACICLLACVLVDARLRVCLWMLACLCACGCSFACVYLCSCVLVDARLLVCNNSRVCLWMLVCLCERMLVCACELVCVSTRLCVGMNVHTYLYKKLFSDAVSSPVRFDEYFHIHHTCIHWSDWKLHRHTALWRDLKI